MATKGYPFGDVSIGMIMMWYGTIASIPDGWSLCNGSSGTPDLRDKFICGAKEDDTVAKTNVTGSLLQTGGTTQHQHAVNLSVADGSVAGALDSGSDIVIDGSGGAITNSVVGGIGDGDVAGDSDSNVAADGVPPFFALAYIMFTG